MRNLEKLEQEYNKKIDEINRKYEKKLSRMHKKSIFIPLALVLSIVFIPSLILIFIWGNKQLGWFANYNGMYLTELPIEEPAKGGTLYLPNDWLFVENDGWYMIVEKDNTIVAYEIYHGYEYSISNDEMIWMDYEKNPELDKYDIDNLSFVSISDGSNNCLVKKYDSYYKLSFYGTCYFKNNKDYSNRTYSREYLFINQPDESLLKKIDASYTWGGEI